MNLLSIDRNFRLPQNIIGALTLGNGDLSHGMFFLLSEFFRACSKMKKAQWGFSFKKSNIHFLKQLCLYFN
jgi:hypothetical protein